VIQDQSSVPAPPTEERPPCACYEGVVFIGRLIETEVGDEVEVVEGVPCRECKLQFVVGE
jgi:hypothetical protein